MDCKHIDKVVEWGYELKDGDVRQFVSLWGCTECDITSTEHLPEEEEQAIDHTKCGPDCFGCKAKNLQLNTGDATRDISDKKWTSELKAYKSARAQGIQPAGTTRKHIEEAHKASETLGRAYDADSMPKAKDITPKAVEVMKELGV